jgi:ligand-binding sensor domain-containing protein
MVSTRRSFQPDSIRIILGFWLILIGVVSNTNCWSQVPVHSEPIFWKLGAEQGFPNTEFYCVIQDNDGYIWIGGDHGICRYDGYEVKHFTSADGLPHDRVTSLTLSPEGNVWALTGGSKLCYFEGDKIIPYRFNNALGKATNHQQYSYAQALDITENNSVYFTSLWNGIIHLNSEGVERVLINDSVHNHSGYFEIDGFQKRYFFQPDSSDSQFIHWSDRVFSYSDLRTSWLPVPAAKQKHTDSHGLFFLEKRILIIDDNELSTVDLDMYIHEVIYRSDTEIWVLGPDGCILYSSLENLKKNSGKKILGGHLIYDVLADKSGGYWIT